MLTERIQYFFRVYIDNTTITVFINGNIINLKKLYILHCRILFVIQHAIKFGIIAAKTIDKEAPNIPQRIVKGYIEIVIKTN